MISSDASVALRLSLPEQRYFVGRKAELSQLESWLGFHQQKLPQKSTVAVWGLSGVGKTQLVSEYVKRQQEKHPACDIFWISGETKEAFEKSIVGFLKVAQGPESRNSEPGGIMMSKGPFSSTRFLRNSEALAIQVASGS